jgi:hypothetical protein
MKAQFLKAAFIEDKSGVKSGIILPPQLHKGMGGFIEVGLSRGYSYTQ